MEPLFNHVVSSPKLVTAVRVVGFLVILRALASMGVKPAQRLLKFLRAIAAMVALLLFAVSITVVFTAALPLLYIFDREHNTVHHAVAGGCFLLGKLFIKTEVIGLANIPADTPCIFVGNHQSFLDMFVCGALWRKPFKVTFKREMLFYPFIGSVMWLAKHLAVNRGDKKAGQALIEVATDAAKAGKSLLFFAEGTRNLKEAGASLGAFKLGAFRVATASGVPIVPFTVSGARALFPPSGIPSLGWGAVRFTVHPPVPAAGKDAIALMEEVRGVVASGLGPVDVVKGKGAPATEAGAAPAAKKEQ